jgi:predicted RNA-binding Zn-ribbon protein involved in translation (DUF1610 family)
MAKMPSFSPYEAPDLICPECGNTMRLEISKHANGKVQALTYFCDSCEYGFESSAVHHNGQMRKYVPKPTSEELAAKAAQETGLPAPQPKIRAWGAK